MMSVGSLLSSLSAQKENQKIQRQTYLSSSFSLGVQKQNKKKDDNEHQLVVVFYKCWKKINDDEPSAHCHHLQVMDKTQENNDGLGFVVLVCKLIRKGEDDYEPQLVVFFSFFH